MDEIKELTPKDQVNVLEVLSTLLDQMATLQTQVAMHIGEIETLELRVTDVEAFQKAIKLRLRQTRENPLG